jgi:hypothetical protein
MGDNFKLDRCLEFLDFCSISNFWIIGIFHPYDLTFDRQGKLYVADYENHRAQVFTIDKSSCTKGTCQIVLLIERSTLVPIFFI